MVSRSKEDRDEWKAVASDNMSKIQDSDEEKLMLMQKGTAVNMAVWGKS